jgi:hypothetical protein
MATITYVKDGPRPDNSSYIREINLPKLQEIIRQHDISCQYRGVDPPEFNEENPSQYPLTVVVEIESHDATGDVFPRTGFYLFPELTTEQAESIFASAIGQVRL